MNTKKIRARVSLNYREIVEKIVDNKSMKPAGIIIWLIRELTILQKYILELLVNRIEQQIKLKELVNG